MATLAPGVRTILLQDFAAALHLHAADPAAACDAVIRLRDRAGCTWNDLIGASNNHGIYAGQLAAYGMSAVSGISSLDCASGVLRFAAWASPAEMARAAILAHAPPENRVPAVAQLEALALALMEREAATRMGVATTIPGLIRHLNSRA